MIGKLTGAKVFAGRYPPGILTNPKLDNYIEVKILLAIDAWPDRNAIIDAVKIGIPVIALCDTNNQTNNIDFVIPANNKGKKSLGLFFWILTREYLRNKGILKKDESILYFSVFARFPPIANHESQLSIAGSPKSKQLPCHYLRLFCSQSSLRAIGMLLVES